MGGRIVVIPQWLVIVTVVVLSFFALSSLLLHIVVNNSTQNSTGPDDLFSQTMDIERIPWGAAMNDDESGSDDDEDDDGLDPKEEYEKQYPPSDRQRIRHYVSTLRKNEYPTQKGMPYDIHNCPSKPPPDYPFSWNVLDVIENWNPDDTTPPSRIYQGLCIFDWDKDFKKAQHYRQAELPFIIQNNPDILQTSERWNRNDGNYLEKILGERRQKTEYSLNNHFMYWKTKHLRIPKGWKEPTEMIKMTYANWLQRAKAMDEEYNNGSRNNKKIDQTEKEHWYFRINAVPAEEDPSANSFMYDELPIFVPDKPKFFMVDPEQQRGINCRFGMRGVIAEAHFDSSRNFIVLLGGERRYILAHPRECPHIELYPRGHPSGRHSAVDWSKPDLQSHPLFGKAMVNEVVLQAGDALYLPTFWFHFIVSLNLNYQCNARSGTTQHYRQDIHDCGFG